MKSTKAKQFRKAAAKKAPARGDARKKSSGKRANIKKPAPKPVKARKRVLAPSAAPKAKPALKPLRSPIVEIVLRAMDDMKAVNIVTLDVRGVTDVADAMIIASGNSDRHVRSIADRVREFAKQAGYRPMGVEGERDGEWVLVDLNDVIVHVMLPRVREFYRLESLWDVTAARREAAQGA